MTEQSCFCKVPRGDREMLILFFEPANGKLQTQKDELSSERTAGMFLNLICMLQVVCLKETKILRLFKNHSLSFICFSFWSFVRSGASLTKLTE